MPNITLFNNKGFSYFNVKTLSKEAQDSARWAALRRLTDSQEWPELERLLVDWHTGLNIYVKDPVSRPIEMQCEAAGELAILEALLNLPDTVQQEIDRREKAEKKKKNSDSSQGGHPYA
jgi:hypothetical protein